MTLPDLTFQVAFGVNPGTVPQESDWVDLSDRMRDNPGITWGYGRRSELDRMEAGVGSVRLDNYDRALDPSNEASPYWPDVKPMVRCRLIASGFYTDTYDDQYGHQLFEGFVEGWTPSWPEQFDALVDVPIVDGFKLLSMARTSASYVEAASGTRIGALLDAASWPASKRDLDTGQSDVQAYTASDRIVLNAIQDAAETEDGVFLITPDGNATFRDRYSRIVSDSQATFGDNDGELPYFALSPNFDDVRLWNDVSAKPDGLTVQRAQDTDSQGQFGQRWLEKDTLHTTEAEADDYANWLIGRYATPRLRVNAIRLEGHQDDAVLTQILERSPGDRVTILRRPPGGGDPMQLDVFVEHVQHRIFGAEWVTTWSLSPAFSETVWLLGVVGFSEIGQTTRLGYGLIVPPFPWLVKAVGWFDRTLMRLWRRHA